MKRNGLHGIAIALVNVLLIALVFVLFELYSRQNRDNLQEENLSNIANLNQSAANVATSYFSWQKERLRDVADYAQKTGFTTEETLNYICQSVTVSDIYEFQLVDARGNGFVAEREEAGYVSVRYSHKKYDDLRAIFAASARDDGALVVSCAPQFTNAHNALQSFALYAYVRLRNADGTLAPYTLMAVSKTRGIISLFNIDGGYQGMSSVLIGRDGDYLLSNADFKATNLFDYFYHYNDLSLDERNAVAADVRAKGEGALFFRNSRDQECVFRYTGISDTDWYCVTAVPLSSFHIRDLSANFNMASAMILLALLVIDVGWLLRMNRRLRQSMDKEKEANNAKTDFLSRMSHDIRTPLNGIIGTTALAMDEPNPPLTAEYLRLIASSGNFLLGLVNDILDMSKVESGKMTLKPEPYRYKEMREYIFAVIGPLARGKDVDFSVSEARDGMPVLMADRLRLNQIVFNLLSNAVKFTPAGGRVECVVTIRETGAGRAVTDITVRDDGIGMSKEFQEHMYEAFSQESRQGIDAVPGTGLGLAIVWNLVRLMGGSIRVESAPGKGSAFFVRLETDICADGDVGQDISANTEILSGKRALVCDDNALNVMIAARLLEKKGMTIETATNGREALDRFMQSSPGWFDAILMDVLMPVMDGLETSRAIRASGHDDAADVPIIAMTANAYASDVQKCLDAGMTDHIAKPVEPGLMYGKLAAHIAEREAGKT